MERIRKRRGGVRMKKMKEKREKRQKEAKIERQKLMDK